MDAYTARPVGGRPHGRAFEADGNQLAFTADSPDGPIYITLTFDGDTFTGS